MRPSVELDFDDAILARYLVGEATVAEQERVQAWAASNTHSAALLTALQRAWRLEEPVPPSFDIEGMIDHVLYSGSCNDVRETPCVGSGPSSRSFKWKPLLRPSWIAAAMIAAIGIAIGIHVPSRHTDAVGAMTTYATARGERANVTLPDGTHVILNVASRIDVPRHFGEQSRLVRLTGEASFSVAHASGMPFVVASGNTRTTVLGTEFEMRAYDTANIQVAVRSGRVMVREVVLGARDMAHIPVSGVMQVQHNQSVEAAFAFTVGRLVITNRPLREAIDALDRWYDVDIRLGDSSLGDAHLDAVLVSGSTSDLMEWLQKALDIHIVRNGRTLTLYSR